MERYAFLVPLTTLVWRERAKMVPIVAMVGSFHGPRMRVVTDFMRELSMEGGVHVIHIPCAKADEIFAGKALSSPHHLSDQTTLSRLQPNNNNRLTLQAAQMIRLYVAALPHIHNNSWIVINDVDMWPLNPDMYRMGKAQVRQGCSDSALSIRGGDCSLSPLSLSLSLSLRCRARCSQTTGRAAARFPGATKCGRNFQWGQLACTARSGAQ
jgi:hypothetical protein